MKITMDNADANYERNKELLRDLQLAELDILKKVTKTFEQSGLCYCLGYGTLLGAIRHQGFIPWDDDVDVFLPRPDFEKFREIADQVLEKPLFLNKDLMPKPICLQHFMRIENPDIKQILPVGADSFSSNVRIDIFPIDGAPKTTLGRKWTFFKAKILHGLIRFRRAYECGVRDIDQRPFMRAMSWINIHFHIGERMSAVKLAQRFDKLRRKYPYEDSEWVAAWTFDYGTRIFCKREWFGEGRKARFEDTLFSVPQNSEAVLQQYYGDYMTPPPEDKRVLKHIAGLAKNENDNKE